MILRLLLLLPLALIVPVLRAERPPVLLTAARLDALKERVASKQEPTYSAFLQVSAAAKAALAREPQAPADGAWKVPGFYQNEAGHRAAKDGLAADAQAAYALALLYRLGGDEHHAAKAADYCLAWTRVRRLSPEADSPLAYSYHFPPLIFAADLLRGSPAWTPEHESAFTSLMELIRHEHRREKYRWPTWTRDNNWGCWGALLGIAASSYLDDAEWFEVMVARARHLIEATIDAKGEIHKEVTRNQGSGTHGIWYSHFTIQPLTLAAEVARHRGVDLFNYASPSGRSLRQAHERLVPWVAEPSTFPYLKSRRPADLHLIDRFSHWELLQTRWPSPAAEKLLDAARPLTSPHGLPFTTLTHAGLPADL